MPVFVFSIFGLWVEPSELEKLACDLWKLENFVTLKSTSNTIRINSSALNYGRKQYGLGLCFYINRD